MQFIAYVGWLNLNNLYIKYSTSTFNKFRVENFMATVIEIALRNLNIKYQDTIVFKKLNNMSTSDKMINMVLIWLSRYIICKKNVGEISYHTFERQIRFWKIRCGSEMTRYSITMINGQEWHWVNWKERLLNSSRAVIFWIMAGPFKIAITIMHLFKARVYF